MVTNQRPKFSRQRGTHTHGWGSKKKHRGAGNRGGRGNAGSGKRGDANKPSNWANKKYFGKHGFNKVNKKKIDTLNIKIIEDNMENYLSEGKAKKEGEFFVLNLADIGCDKLLATGKVTKKMKITACCASKSAVEKIQSIGGEVKVSE